MSWETVIYEKEEGIAVITLNRNEKRNAINVKMKDELTASLLDAAADQQIRVVILTGGTEVFCAGADLRDPPTPPTLWDKISSKRTYSYYHIIEDMGKPVIAAIAGYCLGGGLELACTCDIRIAAENAMLGDAHSKIGLIGGGGSTQRLPRIIGIPKAKELIFSGEPIDAFEAEKIGLVNKVVPTSLLMDEVWKFAVLYSKRPPIVLKLVKAAINDGMEMGIAQGLNYEAKCATLASLTEDYAEGRMAFTEERQTQFKGK